MYNTYRHRSRAPRGSGPQPSPRARRGSSKKAAPTGQNGRSYTHAYIFSAGLDREARVGVESISLKNGLQCIDLTVAKRGWTNGVPARCP